MNSKNLGFATIIYVFLAVIVGVILFQASAQQVGEVTTLGSLSNQTITAAAGGSAYTFTNYKLLSGVLITNATGGEEVLSSNYTVSNNQVVNGALASQLTFDTNSAYASRSLNVSASTAQPLTYITDSGGRSMASIVLILLALAIAVIPLIYLFRERILEALGR